MKTSLYLILELVVAASKLATEIIKYYREKRIK